MGDLYDEEDVLEELTDDMPSLSDDEREEIGIDGGEGLVGEDSEEGSEEIGLDVETLDIPGDELDVDEEDEGYALEDTRLDFEGDLDDSLDEDGWTNESEGTGSAWDNDDDLEDEDETESADDGGLEGVEDPSIDDFAEDGETSIDMEGDDLNAEQDLEHIELDLG